MENGLLDEKKMPKSWGINKILPIYKEKGNAKCCGSYRSVKMLEHGIRIVEKKFEKQLRKQVDIDKMQMGFMPGKKYNRCDTFGKTDDGEMQGCREAMLYGICRLKKGI